MTGAACARAGLAAGTIMFADVAAAFTMTVA